MSGLPIYIDHHSTTPCDRRVVEAMLPYFGDDFGNPAAITHIHGRRAAQALDESRRSIASFLHALPQEIFFTSGATEANNLVFGGVEIPGGAHVIISAVEHKSVQAPAARLSEKGIEVSILGVDAEGFVSADALGSAIRNETMLVSVMAANGEIGTVQPVQDLARVCRERSILFHTDATQAVGKIDCHVDQMQCDLLSFSAHKFYGPKGVGGLFVRQGVRLSAQTLGGGQESRLRSGTVNVPGVVGMARALELRAAEMAGEGERLTLMRNGLWDRIASEIGGSFVHGPRRLRLPGNLNVSFDGVDAESMIHALRHFSLSSGSACSAADREVSSVLRAIGVSDELALASLRIGMGKANNSEEMDMLLADLKLVLPRLRELSAHTV